MVVIPQRHAEVGGPLADFGQQLAHPLEIRGHDGALRPLVGDLQVQSANVADEFRVPRVLRDLFLLDRGIEPHVSARQRHHRQAVLCEQIRERARRVPELLDDWRAKLDALEADRGDLFDRLQVVALPCDGGVAERDVARRNSGEGMPAEHGRGARGSDGGNEVAA
jgi:hypothetical protein